MAEPTRTHTSDSLHQPQLARAGVFGRVFVTICVWTALVLICTAGAVTHTPPEGVGRFVSVSLGAIVLGMIGWAASWGKRPILSTLLFAVGLALSVAPTLAFDTTLRQRSVALDLFYVLLIAVPAFLASWSWRWQASLSVAALFSVWIVNSTQSAAAMFHAGTLSAITGVLSSLVVFLKVGETRRGGASVAIGVDAAAVEDRELPSWTRQTFVFQAAVVTGAIVLDSWRGYDELSSAVLPKVYGLMVLIFGGLFATIAGSRLLPYAVAITSLGVTLSFSVARFGYPGTTASCVVPMVLILCSTGLMRWVVERQIGLIWATLIGDLIIKAWGSAGSGVVPSFAELGIAMGRFRQENLMLLAGAMLSLWLSSALRRQYFGGLVRVLYRSGQEREVSESEKIYRIPDSHHVGLVPERNRRLLFALFLLGICANAVASRAVLQNFSEWNGAIIFAWVGFLAYWGMLVQQERRNPEWVHLWPLGALLALILFAWPIVIFLGLDHLGHFWLWWPLGVLLSIGAVPWQLRELIPLFGVEAVIGVELVIHRGVAEEGALVCAGSSLLAILVSRRLARELRARVLLTRFHIRLSSCSTELDTLRVLADALGGLVEGSTVFFSKAAGHFEVVGEGVAYDPGREILSLRALRREVTEMTKNPMGIGATTVRVMSDPKDDEELGGWVRTRRGCLVELRMREERLAEHEIDPADLEDDLEHPGRSRAGEDILLLIIAASPLQLAFPGETIAVGEILASAAKMRLVTILKEQARRRAITDAELQVSQREYELSALVHDINNTVQDLTLLCELIHEALPTIRTDEGLAELSQRVRRISVLARSVATVVSDAKRRRELERIEDLSPRELVEVSGVVADLATFATVRAERKRITVEPPVPSGEELWVRVSVREHLETILRNLLNNAITYSNPGTTIRLRVRADEQWVSIDVEDNGPGLTPEECEQIFRPGVRGAAASGIQGGLGVGLSESRRVAESAAGTVTVHSDGLGKGATFTVALPRQKLSASSPATVSWALLVDDQPTLTDFYARIARAFHLVPEVASSVPEAFDVIERKGRPTLVMTDIHLGGSDGLEIVRRIRAEYGLGVPVVVISGLTSEDVVQRARAAGATDFVPKPVGRRALYARVQSLLV